MLDILARLSLRRRGGQLAIFAGEAIRFGQEFGGPRLPLGTALLGPPERILGLGHFRGEALPVALRPRRLILGRGELRPQVGQFLPLVGRSRTILQGGHLRLERADLGEQIGVLGLAVAHGLGGDVRRLAGFGQPRTRRGEVGDGLGEFGAVGCRLRRGGLAQALLERGILAADGLKLAGHVGQLVLQAANFHGAPTLHGLGLGADLLGFAPGCDELGQRLVQFRLHVRQIGGEAAAFRPTLRFGGAARRHGCGQLLFRCGQRAAGLLETRGLRLYFAAERLDFSLGRGEALGNGRIACGSRGKAGVFLAQLAIGRLGGVELLLQRGELGRQIRRGSIGRSRGGAGRPILGAPQATRQVAELDCGALDLVVESLVFAPQAAHGFIRAFRSGCDRRGGSRTGGLELGGEIAVLGGQRLLLVAQGGGLPSEAIHLFAQSGRGRIGGRWAGGEASLFGLEPSQLFGRLAQFLAVLCQLAGEVGVGGAQ